MLEAHDVRRGATRMRLVLPPSPSSTPNGRKLLAVLVLVLITGLLCGCRSSKEDPSSKTGKVDPTSNMVRREQIDSDIFPVPKDSSPTEVFTTTSQSLVVKVGEITPSDKFHRSLYSWEPGQQPKLIIAGHFLEAIRLSDDEFAAEWYSENNESSPVEFVTLNVSGLTSQPINLPPSGPAGWGGCEGNLHYVVCIGNVPTMKVDDKDYDEMGFTAVLVIDLEQRKTSWFPVQHQTYFRYNSLRKLIYVGDFVNPTMSSPMTSFDLSGHEHGATEAWDVFLSPSGHFAESLQEDGSETWSVYEASSKKTLFAFNCDKPECKVGDREESHYWNPVFDGQFVALGSGGAGGRGGTCDIYQISPPSLLKEYPCDGLPVVDWSRDGRKLITIQGLGGKFHSEAVN